MTDQAEQAKQADEEDRPVDSYTVQETLEIIKEHNRKLESALARHKGAGLNMMTLMMDRFDMLLVICLPDPEKRDQFELVWQRVLYDRLTEALEAVLNEEDRPRLYSPTGRKLKLK